MDELLEAVAYLVTLVSPEKVHAISKRIRLNEQHQSSDSLVDFVSRPAAIGAVRQLTEAWDRTSVSSAELASMLLAAERVHARIMKEQSVELVWTGPTTFGTTARKTEQVMIEVINESKQQIFITSYVATALPLVVSAIRDADSRGVSVSILLESSKKPGGRLTFDSIAKLRDKLPFAKFYSWDSKILEHAYGSVHAKVIVADSSMCFITSANLTDYALNRNIEIGVLISGGEVPRQLHDLLDSLVRTGTVEIM